MVQQLGQLPMGWLLTALIIFVVTTGFSVGRIRSERYLVSGRHKFHSRGNYHGYYVAMWGLLPTLFIASAYILFSRAAIFGWLDSELPEGFRQFSRAELQSYLEAVSAAARTGGYTGADRIFATVTNRYLELSGSLNGATLGAMVLAAIGGIAYARRQVAPAFRARLKVERGAEAFLFLCAAIAIATTVGIVASLLYESIRFSLRCR